MITPRATRLVRVPDLKAMRAAIARLAAGGSRTAVIGHGRTRATEQHGRRNNTEQHEPRNNTEQHGQTRATVQHEWVEYLTRTEFYSRLHAGLAGAPRLLPGPEREVLLRRAAREAAAGGAVPPFRLRPGIIVQMLDFYDELRRREQRLDDFERLVTGTLAPSVEIDRGAERLMRQTEFLCAAFGGFERACARSGGIDEHDLRGMLVAGDAAAQDIYEHVVVTVPDQAADPRGLYASDFDLLTRLGGLTRVDVIATEALLASGFHERLHDLLPGIEEERSGEAAPPPTLVAPETPEPDQRWFVCRDREEELVEFARYLKQRSASTHDPLPPLDRVGIVFQRPLPYLYLARQVFADAGLPYQALDALPLSGEPFAATIDVIFTVLESEANRASLVELLASPHLTFSAGLTRAELARFDDWLRDRKYAGGWLGALPADPPGPDARKVLDAALAAIPALRQVLEAPQASAQIDALLTFLHGFERLPDAHDEAPWAVRHRRARTAILSALRQLRDAHAAYDDEPVDVVELSGAVRRWIEAETFSPRTGAEGIRLLDAASAPYADLDELRIVGLVERDWPEPPRRSIFYPAAMLASLGWPADASRQSAARAQFQDLLGSPRTHVSVSTFTLEEDAIVPGSPFLEEIEASGLEVERVPAQGPGIRLNTGAADSAWLALRQSRTPSTDPRFHGAAGPREPRSYGISYLERYLACPFKYFANQVLKLPEERDEESGLTPIERGHLIHDVFETFFRDWQAAGRRTITIDNVGEALELFEQVAERKLEGLAEADRALERNHLLGSAAASGLAERALGFEIEQGGDVIERLLEHELEGEFTFAGAEGPRRVRIRAKADRIDLMADGTLRIIDYKTGRAPKAGSALQLPIYGVMARQALEGRHGRSWAVSSAGYVAFKEKDPFVSLAGRGATLAEAMTEGEHRLVAAVEGIERGEFPVRPEEPFKCQWCGYAGVCRKDYVGDE